MSLPYLREARPRRRGAAAGRGGPLLRAGRGRGAQRRRGRGGLARATAGAAGAHGRHRTSTWPRGCSGTHGARHRWAVAPTTLQRAAHEDGEVATARAAAAAGALMVVSSNAGSTFEEIAATGVSWWLQMYVTSDRTRTTDVVQRAVDAGAGAVVLTADTPVVARKEVGERSVWDVVDPAWVRANFAEDGAEKARDLGPQDVAWLAGRFDVPVVVKGVLHPADARRAVDAGRPRRVGLEPRRAPARPRGAAGRRAGRGRGGGGLATRGSRCTPTEASARGSTPWWRVRSARTPSSWGDRSCGDSPPAGAEGVPRRARRADRGPPRGA